MALISKIRNFTPPNKFKLLFKSKANEITRKGFYVPLKLLWLIKISILKVKVPIKPEIFDSLVDVCVLWQLPSSVISIYFFNACTYCSRPDDVWQCETTWRASFDLCLTWSKTWEIFQRNILIQLEIWKVVNFQLSGSLKNDHLQKLSSKGQYGG